MVKVKVKTKGIPQIARKLNALVKKIDEGSDLALVQVGALIKDTAAPLAPMYTGNLRNTAYAVVAGKGEVDLHARAYANATGQEILNFEAIRAAAIKRAFGRVGSSAKVKKLEVGFGAEYASKVHEAVGRTFRVGGAKFLENTITTIRPQLLGKIVKVIKL